MADYEDLVKQTDVFEKELKDKINAIQKLFKSINNSMDKGDLKSWTRDVECLKSSLQESENVLDNMKETVDNFEIREYIESGDFANQLMSGCEQFGVDVKGDFPNYEMFPFRVRLDIENMDMYIDRKKVQCLRPFTFVRDVKAMQAKMLKASFDPSSFAGEIANAYDLALLRQNQGKSHVTSGDVYLKNLYNFLTPMRRFRKDYDQQSFAFDLARLYSSEIHSIDDGRKFQFGPSRNINKCVRILDKDGREEYLATIRFFAE